MLRSDKRELEILRAKKKERLVRLHGLVDSYFPGTYSSKSRAERLHYELHSYQLMAMITESISIGDRLLAYLELMTLVTMSAFLLSLMNYCYYQLSKSLIST